MTVLHGRHGPGLRANDLVRDDIEGDACEKDYDLVDAGSHRVEGWKRFLLKSVERPSLDGVDRPVPAVKRSSSTPA